ncbi:MAG: putative Histidine kinase [Nitrospira sp.]|jgi:signal transduction histidine kinase|nr:putative Histidine kinase [Nitrospira sp.]
MGIRILVADDDADIVMSLSERLRWLGHDVVTAADGQAALAAVESHALDLAFFDVSMPRLNGIEALKIVRKRWPDLPVVVVTAYGTIRLAVEAMKEGAVDFITKPFEQGQIDQTVTTLIARMGQRVEMTRLMGEITHDVKNLLMPLVAGTDLLAEEIDDVFKHLPTLAPAQAQQSHLACDEVITMFRNTSRRIQDRMKAIADYAALTRVSQKFESCLIGKIADSVVKSLRAPAERKQVVLKTDGLHTLPAIVGDEARLYSLLYNLVNNAIPEVPPQGSVTIKGAFSAGDDCVTLWVSDTGVGMPADMRDNLFTYRLVSTKAGGTGLGTKIIKEVVDMHGGQITVESEPGQGTTFEIRLPIEGPTFLQNSDAAAQTGHNQEAS